MSVLIFWAAVAWIVYAYLLFPLLLWLRAGLWPQPFRREAITPSVSLIVAAHNEERNIRSKLQNALAIDYPRDVLEVMIVTDGCNDATPDIVREFAPAGVRLLELPRVGKAEALNRAVEQTRGEILAFSDANSLFSPEALRELVSPFADSAVGGVVGNQCYLPLGAAPISAPGEASYWSFDRWMKALQSRGGSTTSATGAIYAIRKSLFVPVVPGVTDDFATSTAVVLQGFRLVFAPDARAYEPIACSTKAEFGRKVRIITRGFRAVVLRRRLLNPVRYGFYSLQLLSHKVLRRLVVFPLLAVLGASPWLWEHGALYQAAVVAQVGMYLSAVIAALFAGTQLGRVKLFSLPLFLCLVNAASLVAVFNLMRGRHVMHWQPQRSTG